MISVWDCYQGILLYLIKKIDSPDGGYKKSAEALF